MFTEALFTTSRHGNNLNVHWQMNGLKRCDVINTHTHTHNGILLSHKKNEIM